MLGVITLAYTFLHCLTKNTIILLICHVLQGESIHLIEKTLKIASLQNSFELPPINECFLFFNYVVVNLYFRRSFFVKQ